MMYFFFPCSTFEANSGSNGIVSIAYAPVVFDGINVFTNNTGTSALRVSNPENVQVYRDTYYATLLKCCTDCWLIG